MEYDLTKNEKICLAMKGRTLSKEHIKKLSIAKCGTTRTHITKAKIKQIMLGVVNNHLRKNHPSIPKSSNSRSDLTATDVKKIRDRYSNEKIHQYENWQRNITSADIRFTASSPINYGLESGFYYITLQNKNPVNVKMTEPCLFHTAFTHKYLRIQLSSEFFQALIRGGMLHNARVRPP